jgi:hypothetical protein
MMGVGTLGGIFYFDGKSGSMRKVDVWAAVRSGFPWLKEMGGGRLRRGVVFLGELGGDEVAGAEPALTKPAR